MKMSAPSQASLGRTEQGAEIDLELLLLPLAFDGRTRVRALGALAPVDAALFGWAIRPVAELELGTLSPCRRDHRLPAIHTSGRPARSLACGTAFASTAGASHRRPGSTAANSSLTIG